VAATPSQIWEAVRHVLGGGATVYSVVMLEIERCARRPALVKFAVLAVRLAYAEVGHARPPRTTESG